MPLVAAGAGDLVSVSCPATSERPIRDLSVAETSLIRCYNVAVPAAVIALFFAASSLFLAAVFWPDGKLLQRVDGNDKKSGSEPAAERPAEPDFPIRRTGASDTHP
jgi:hypothetical protein